MAMNGDHRNSDVGVLPADWRIVPLGQLVTSVEYGSSTKSLPSGEVPVLRMGNLQEGKVVWDDLVYTDSPAEIAKYSLKSGDVLFNRTNTVDLVGKTSLYSGERPAIFAGYLIRITVAESKIDPRYLNYVLNTKASKAYSAKVLSVAVGQANINGQKLKTYPIPLPPTRAEQNVIADALSDADAFIESLEQLLARKRQIKQGAIHELLAGKNQLPGFRRPWERRSVAELGTIVGGKALDVHGTGAMRPYLRTKNVLDGRIDLEDVLWMPMTDSEFDRFSLKAGDVLLNEGQSLELVGRCSIYSGEFGSPCSMQNQLLRFRAHAATSPEFAAHVFRNCQRAGVFAAIATQTTSVAHLGSSRFANLRLLCPTDRFEQESIAGILTDMDAEISAVEAQLAKARQIKLGMMQDLLSGRTRLK